MMSPARSEQARAVRPYRLRIGRGLRLRDAVIAAGLAAAIVWSTAPVVWIALTGLKDQQDVYRWPPVIIPRHATLRNFVDIFRQRPFASYMRNSTIVAVATVAVSGALSLTAGYGFSKFPCRWKGFWLGAVLLSRAVPPPSLLVPFYAIGKALHIVNTHLILIVTFVYITLPLNIWIVKSFFDSFPDELLDAAETDGCSRAKALVRVVLPNVWPASAAVGIITFMLAWNELLYAVVFTTTPAAKTLPPGITDFFGDFHIIWTQLGAAASLAILPAVLFTVLFSSQMVRGLTEGSVKG